MMMKNLHAAPDKILTFQSHEIGVVLREWKLHLTSP